MFAVSEREIDIPLMSVLDPVFDSLAREANIKSIRIHSEHRGIGKMVEKHGYNFLETIFVKRIN
jgi:hypothetical protein